MMVCVHRRAFLVLPLGAALLVAAGTLLTLQVRVHSSGVSASCGAPFDVVSGRANWQRWFTADLADPRTGDPVPLVRTEACPAAANRRTAIAGTAAAAGVALIAAALLTRSDPVRHRKPRPLRALGGWVTGVGAALTAAGLIGLVVLLANGDAVLFLYVDRWVVAIIGMLLLVPAIALTAAGGALLLIANGRVDAGAEDDAS